jgi:hypothetical protein
VFFVRVKSRLAHRREAIVKEVQAPRGSLQCPGRVAGRRAFWSKYSTLVAFLFASGFTSGASDWQSTLSKEPPGNSSELRPLRATYRFGWGGFTAATGEVHFTKPSSEKFQLDATGRTVGLVRALWRLDVNYQGLANAETLRPIETRQTETYRSKNIATHLIFTNNGVTSSRTEGQSGAAGTKTRQFNFSNLFDLHSAMLYLRSQPLRDRSVYRVVVYPASSAYLATTTVVGREKIAVRAGTYDAIKIDLQLSRLGKHLELEPHRKFRRATIWVSNDSDRMLLRIEAQIFVGTIFSELQSVRFESPRS